MGVVASGLIAGLASMFSLLLCMHMGRRYPHDSFFPWMAAVSVIEFLAAVTLLIVGTGVLDA